MFERFKSHWLPMAAGLLGFEDSPRNTGERRKSVRYFAAVFIPGAVIFGLVDIRLGRPLIAALLLSTAGALAVCWRIFAIKRVIACELLIMAACTALAVGLVYDGGMIGAGIHWLLLYPFIAFIIRGQRRGWYWVGILVLIVAILMVLQAVGRVRLAYDDANLAYFFGTFFFFTLLAAGLSLLRRRYERLLEVEVDAQSRTALGYLKRLEYLALYDPLTDLPNRHLAKDRISHAIEDAKRQSHAFAIGLLDIENFNEVNTLLGHQKADVVLKMVARRLSKTVRGVDTVARVEGDEFLIVWPGVDASSIDTVAGKVRAAFERPFDLKSTHISLTVCLGAVIYPQHGNAVSDLLQHVGMVHRRAKAERLSYAIYQSEWHSEALRRIHLLGRMRTAIADGAMTLAYQPQVSLADGSIPGVEALLRWSDPEEGPISPGEFVPLAEQTRLIDDLTLMALDMAARQNRDWRDRGMDVRISVNLSARNMIDLDLPDKIHEYLHRYDGLPAHFKFEITETDIMAHPDLALAVMHKINAMGIALSIDDFGTGYSSLTYLRQLPADELKIDRAFIHGFASNENDRKIVSSVLSLAHAMDMGVVAEGVEDIETWRALQGLGMDKAQGFLISRPLPPDEFTAWLHARKGIYGP